MKCRGAAQVCKCPAGRHKNLFKVFLELHKCLAGMGCKAQRAAHIHPRWPVLLASGVTPQTARQATCPKGWSEIGPMNLELWRSGCLHGHEPMWRIRSLHSSRLHSNAISKKTLNRF